VKPAAGAVATEAGANKGTDKKPVEKTGTDPNPSSES
jgi:hypothetical protein